jgi:hypothetical protein
MARGDMKRVGELAGLNNNGLAFEMNFRQLRTPAWADGVDDNNTACNLIDPGFTEPRL